MWIMVMFDLPTDTKESRRAYTRFRNKLLDDGFCMLQFSVYARPCPSEENMKVHLGRVKRIIPADGEVRTLMFTDLQFSRMEIHQGKKKIETEKMPLQLSFF